MNKIKFYSILLLISIFGKAAKSVEMTEEMKEIVEMLHNNCRDETGIAEDIISAAQSGTFAEDEKLKCYMKCIMSEMSTMDDDGTIDVEATIALMPEDIRGKITPTIRKCGILVGANACDNAFLMFKCYYEDNKEYYYLP